MQDIILYGELDIYNYLDFTNYEIDYFNILNIKNKRYPAKIVYNIANKELYIYVSFPRDIIDSKIITLMLRNNKVSEAKYFEVDRWSLFVLKFGDIKFYIPKVKLNKSIYFNIIGGTLTKNSDSTILLYQDVNSINEIFFGLQGENFLKNNDLVYIYKVNLYNNINLIALCNIRDINNNIITVKSMFLKNSNNIIINNSNDYIMVKYYFDSIEPLSGLLLDNYLSLDPKIEPRINYLINLTK